MLQEAFAVFANLKDVQLCTSMWAVTEMVNILVSRKNLDRGVVAEIESQLVSEKRIRGLKIQIIEVSPRKDYDFAEFFYHVKQGILKYHSGVGDVIHSVIMKNNGISQILTFDEKDDFKQIPDLTVLHPRDIKIQD
jgi:predicted nucleic acid-binding protein